MFVTGTPGDDHVLISLDVTDPSKLTVNFNGDVQSFDRTSITSIDVEAGAGPDQIVVDESAGGITIPMTLNGGGGNDLIVAGSGDDVIYGGTGHDRIDGGGGNDLIFGGASRDQISGGDGADTLLGGTGDDAIDGGAGNDSIIAGNGDDYVDAGAGDDSVSGGADYDSIIGGAGNDHLSGGKGEDDLDGGTGADSLTGGAGDDSFAYSDNAHDYITDKTTNADRVYTPVGLDFVPQGLQTLFAETFPNSVPTGVRVNNDHTFVLLYTYNGDGSVYHAYFTFTGTHPFSDTDASTHYGVDLVTYEVAPQNTPADTEAQFHTDHPDAVVIKSVYADRDGDSKFAVIRYTDSTGQIKTADEPWLDNGEDN